MQQRQLRLGDILDDYCPRERRVTNHAVVAMIGEEVKQTRCTTCDAEHVYRQARIPRQRRKDDAPAALYAQVAAGAPKRVVPPQSTGSPAQPADEDTSIPVVDEPAAEGADETVLAEDTPHSASSNVATDADEDLEDAGGAGAGDDDGPVHRPLIRASLPRPDGQQPPARPIPEFTIRQPGGGRPNRFRPRHHRGGPGGGQGHQGHQGHQFHGNTGNRSGNVGGPMHGSRPNAGRPGMAKRHGPPGRKRSK
jgi:hypothetical protein